MAEGYAYLNGAVALDGWCQFSGLKPAEGETYIEKETETLVKIAKEAWQSKSKLI